LDWLVCDFLQPISVLSMPEFKQSAFTARWFPADHMYKPLLGSSQSEALVSWDSARSRSQGKVNQDSG
jgi:hypothetical protein